MDKFKDDMSDNEIRILGSDQAGQTKSLRPRKGGKRLLVVILVAIAVLVMCIFGCLAMFNQAEPIESNIANSMSEETINTESESKGYVSKQDTTINDIPLTIIVPHSSKVDLFVGDLEKYNGSFVLAAQAADVRDDKDLPTGAFVCDGNLISKGHAKYGFCAIFGNSITLGRQSETPLFEKAIEENGSFFRQYSLVSNGKLMTIPPKGKSLRKALCLYNKKIVVIESKDRESFHDFSQSLVDLGVKEALALVGGDGIMIYRYETGEIVKEGTPFMKRMQSENYIIWK